MKKIVELYKGILPLLGISVAANDQLFLGGGEFGNILPLTIEGKNIFLPTDEYLTSTDAKNSIAFHPMAEDILKKRSPMLTAIQKALEVRLYTCGILLTKALIHAAIKQKKGEVFDLKALKYLSGNEALDEKTLQFINKLFPENPTEKNPFFTVYFRHANEQTDGCLRQIVITCPLVTELERVAAINGNALYGVEAPRKKDILLLANAIKTIFPGIEDRSYTVGSSDPVAPYCDALFESLHRIGNDIFNVGTALSSIEIIKGSAQYVCATTTALDELLATKDNYDIYRNSIVKTAYNDGGEYTNEVRSPQEVERPATDIPEQRETVSHRQPEAPVVITKEVVANRTVATPGTRQPLISGITEEDYRLQRGDRPTNRNPNLSVISDRIDQERRSTPSRNELRPYYSRGFKIRDFRSVREVNRELDDLDALYREYQAVRDRASVEEIDYDIRALERIADEFNGERPRGREDDRRSSSDRFGRDSGGYRSRYEDDDRGGRGGNGRPTPRAYTEYQERGGRNDSRGGTDRFGRRRY